MGETIGQAWRSVGEGAGSRYGRRYLYCRKFFRYSGFWKDHSPDKGKYTGYVHCQALSAFAAEKKKHYRNTCNTNSLSLFFCFFRLSLMRRFLFPQEAIIPNCIGANWRPITSASSIIRDSIALRSKRRPLQRKSIAL